MEKASQCSKLGEKIKQNTVTKSEHICQLIQLDILSDKMYRLVDKCYRTSNISEEILVAMVTKNGLYKIDMV